MVKNMQKCLRLNDEIYKIVDSYEGAGFNQKFEKLVLDFKNTLPERERQKAELDKEISKKREELQKLRQSIDRVSSVKTAVDRLYRELDV